MTGVRIDRDGSHSALVSWGETKIETSHDAVREFRLVNERARKIASRHINIKAGYGKQPRILQHSLHLPLLPNLFLWRFDAFHIEADPIHRPMQLAGSQVGVDLGGGDAAVAEEFLDLVE